MKILSIFVQYDREKYPKALIEVIRIQKRIHANWDTLIIDNKLDSNAFKPIQSNITLIGGDNSYWEFSAWDKGVSYIANELFDYDLINFVTDSFQSSLHNIKYLDYLNSSMLQKLLGKNVALGHIDAFPEFVGIRNHLSRLWLCTAFFFLTPPIIKILKKLNWYSENMILFSGNVDKPFHPNAIINQTYQKYILGWLTGIGKKSRLHNEYHSEMTLTKENLIYFQKKTISILNEHMITLRLIENDIKIIDALWMNYHSDSLFDLDINNIPSLEDQFKYSYKMHM